MCFHSLEFKYVRFDFDHSLNLRDVDVRNHLNMRKFIPPNEKLQGRGCRLQTCPVMFLTNSAPGPRGRDRARVPARASRLVFLFLCVCARVYVLVLSGARRRGSDGDTPPGLGHFFGAIFLFFSFFFGVISAGVEPEIH